MLVLVAWMLVLAAMLAGCSTVPQRGAPEAGPSRTLYVIRRGWHIDVGFDASAVDPPLTSLLAPFPGAEFMSVGFGDRHYLIARHRNFPGMLAAIWPGEGVLLVTAVKAAPEEAFGINHVIAIPVTAAQEEAAEAFIWKSLVEKDGIPDVNAPGPYEGSEYLASKVRYSGLYTCNTWAADVLKSAGLPVRSTAVVFAGQVWSQARRVSAELAVGDQTENLEHHGGAH